MAEQTHELKQKIWFIQLLRALASVLVVIFHLVTWYWCGDNLRYNESFFNRRNIDQVPDWIQKVAAFQDGFFSLGGYGVAVFFLVSGFVIPMALENISIKTFVVRRFFRLYPAVIFAVLWGYGCYVLVGKLAATPLPFTFDRILLNATLLSGIFDTPLTLGVLWTLEIEIKFYILAAILKICSMQSSRAKKYGIIVSLGVLATYSSAMELWLISYMLIGTAFYAHATQKFSKTTKWLYVAVCMGIGCGMVAYDLLSLSKVINGAAAIGTFWLCIVWQKKMAYSKVINFFAECSYPLYLMHSITSYTLFAILSPFYINIYIKLLLAAVISVILAYSVHVCIEKPALQFGKRLRV